ncbi:hypothetical protein OIU77_029071 [Salix suchowensis]|uniref:Proline-rich protein n=1 Tax=Salix suchowensis TaxID=1278906 RepID=A0ABQ9BLZ9_9ROSI|nr:hypothetical protein OIU77_029071 [Salix suchowensis]
MRIVPVFRGALLCFHVSLVFAAAFCYADDSTVEVIGMGECADCAQSNVKTAHAFSGLKVTIDCKPGNGDFKTRGVGELDEEGKFRVSLPNDVVKDGRLKEECYAQLHSASAAPCPVQNGIESSKIVFKSKTDEKHTFGLAGKLKFSPATCTSAILWPHPPKSKLPPWKLPPVKEFHHPYLFSPKVFPPLPPKTFPPIYKKPLPPIYKPKPPVYKLPPVPIYKPKPTVYKFPPVPIYKPKPPVYKFPPVPIYKPKPPVYKFPPVPIYKPKPKPPVYKFPPVPIYKPKPPVYKFPPVPIYKPKPKPPVYKPTPSANLQART